MGENRNRRLPTQMGRRIKKRLLDKNMTQKELADQLGIKSPYLSRILSGDRSGKKYLPAIRKILEMDDAA